MTYRLFNVLTEIHVLFVLSVLFQNVAMSHKYGTDTREEDPYYYYYEADLEQEEEPSSTTVSRSIRLSQTPVQLEHELIIPPLTKYGFVNSNDAFIPRDTSLWGSDAYLNFTAKEYDCPLQRLTENRHDALTAEDLAAVEHELRTGDAEDDEDDVASRILELAVIMTPAQRLAAEAAAEAEAASALEVEAAVMTPDERATWLKKLSFRQRTSVLTEERRVQAARRERGRELFSLGASCERRICVSCRIIVEEFGLAVIAAVTDPKIEQVGDLAAEEGQFCNRPELYMQYGPQVYDTCRIIMRAESSTGTDSAGGGYRQALVTSFEQADSEALRLLKGQEVRSHGPSGRYLRYWDFIAGYRDSYLFQKQQHVCTEIGACTYDDNYGDGRLATDGQRPGTFSAATQAPMRSQTLEEQPWNATCRVCQMAVRDMEARALLASELDDSSTITTIIQRTCSRLVSSSSSSSSIAVD